MHSEACWLSSVYCLPTCHATRSLTKCRATNIIWCAQKSFLHECEHSYPLAHTIRWEWWCVSLQSTDEKKISKGKLVEIGEGKLLRCQLDSHCAISFVDDVPENSYFSQFFFLCLLEEFELQRNRNWTTLFFKLFFTRPQAIDVIEWDNKMKWFSFASTFPFYEFMILRHFNLWTMTNAVTQVITAPRSNGTWLSFLWFHQFWFEF